MRGLEGLFEVGVGVESWGEEVYVVCVDQVQCEMGSLNQDGSLINAAARVIGSHDSLCIHNVGCAFKGIIGKGNGGICRIKNSK